MTATSAEIKEALRRRYCGADLTGTQYVCLEEARSGAGFDGNVGQCDFLAINTFKGRGMELIGHEIKVSMADWKKELASPEKAELFARYCRRWFVAVPSALAAKIKDEVPAAWGLLSLSDKGRLTEIRKAPARKDAVEPPAWWWIGWMAQVDRQVKKLIPSMVNAAMIAERERIENTIEQRVKSALTHDERRIGELRENVATFKEVTGIDIAGLWNSRVDRLRQAWALVESGYDVDQLVRTLRSTADALDVLATPSTSTKARTA